MKPIELEFDIDSGSGERARIGVIVLETDMTLEVELSRLGVPGVAFYHSRIANDATVTPETLTAMAGRIPSATGLFSPGLGLSVVGYGCTSAATLIGTDVVESAVRSVLPDVVVTDPISAAIEAFTALGAARISVITPYSAAVTAPIVEHFEMCGVEVASVGSFLEEDDLTVGRITERSIVEAVRSLAASSDPDAFFVSCTSLRAFGVAHELERETGKPVVSSNLAFAWHMLRSAGIDDRVQGLGSLFERCLAGPNG